jgi:hypothetical protein
MRDARTVSVPPTSADFAFLYKLAGGSRRQAGTWLSNVEARRFLPDPSMKLNGTSTQFIFAVVPDRLGYKSSQEPPA